MSSPFQRLLSFAAAAVFAVPMSLVADSRSPQRTDLEQLAADLARVLGPEHVTVEGRSAADSSPRPTRPRPATAEEQSLVDAMNRERAARGLEQLHLDEDLDGAAHDRANDMLRQHYFAHVSPEGVQPWVWVDRRGYNYRTVAENLATGYPTVDAVVDGWMHSQGHRENLLGRFHDVGVAIVEASPARHYSGPLVVAIYGSR